jgi:hypothetical protein
LRSISNDVRAGPTGTTILRLIAERADRSAAVNDETRSKALHYFVVGGGRL